MSKVIDLTGKKYGRLNVIELSHTKNKRSYWKCVCECGKETITCSNNMRSGTTTSCGCYMKEKNAENVLKIYPKGVELAAEFLKNNYDVWYERFVETDKRKKGASGFRGVYWKARRQMWSVELGYKKKRYYLGYYKDLEDAVKARLKAEEEIMGRIVSKVDFP